MKKRKSNTKNIRTSQFISKNDPFGSYTGNSFDGTIPVQDADDL